MKTHYQLPLSPRGRGERVGGTLKGSWTPLPIPLPLREMESLRESIG